MNLDQITADIRLRTPWEAVDLGFAMVRRWWKSIYLPLMAVTFTIALLLFFITPEDQRWVALLVFWWLKPLYDRLVLHMISHQLFNDTLGCASALKALPGLLMNSGFFQSLTWRRFSLSRGFNLPVWQLEQLRGKERLERQRLMHLANHSQAIALTICMVLFEWILLGSLFVLVLLFLPGAMADDFLQSLLGNSPQFDTLIAVLNSLFYVLAVTLLHPFYIAANFALYLNRRTQLEAWDIELDFRRLAQRLEQAGGAILTWLIALLLPLSLTVSLILINQPAQAKPLAADQSMPGQVHQSAKRHGNLHKLAQKREAVVRADSIIREVMQHPDLGQDKRVKRWVRKKQPAQNAFDFFDLQWLDSLFDPVVKIIAWLIESILWFVLALALYLLYYTRRLWLPLFEAERNIKPAYQPPEILFGMDIRADSLPDDLIGEARRLWHQGRPRDALSLIYRGALAKLVNSDRIEINTSHTEGDILALSAGKLQQKRLDYLEQLTHTWQCIAYAHGFPDEKTMQSLFARWLSDFVPTDRNNGATIYNTGQDEPDNSVTRQSTTKADHDS